MKYVRKIVSNIYHHSLKIKQKLWLEIGGSAGVRNDQYRKVVTKLQGDWNENDRIYVNKLKFTHCRENFK
jgi:hypothetical protein